jgi:MinD-like ATPase involved in chromosome partitioning or flagellar assembly
MGKTTIAKHLLAPRMIGARIIVLESTNAGSDELQSPIHIDIDDFASLVDVMTLEDNLIVDLGSSEAKELIRKLKEYETSVHEFDLIIVPTISDPKALEDTITTVMTLNALGVSKEKIRIVFNKVPVHQAAKVAILFEPLIQAVNEMATINLDLVIFQYEIYNSLKGSQTTVSDVIIDKTDWKAAARDSTGLSESERLDALQNNRNQKAAPTALRNLDSVFELLCA